MGRPQKLTVDYFPHYTKDGKTLFVLESRYRNDGYAFWFKLLTLLSATSNHVLVIRNPQDWQYLLAKTLVDEDTGTKILNLLAELEAIDSELWMKYKAIWVQHLVDNFADVYKKRGQPLPQRPVITRDNPVSGSDNPVSGSDNSQTKLNNSKLNNSKVEKDKKIFGQFQNVLLTEEEYRKLTERFGAAAPDKIETLSEGIASRGYKYKSHYAAILSWTRKDERYQKEAANGTNRQGARKVTSRQLPGKYESPEEYRARYNREHPAVRP